MIAEPEVDRSDGRAIPAQVRADRTWWAAVGAIALAGLAVRLVYIVRIDQVMPDISDPLVYRELARSIARGDGYTWFGPLPDGDLAFFPTAKFPIGWPALLAVVAWLGFDEVRHLQVVGALIGTLSIVAVAVLARMATGRDRVGLVAAGLAAASPGLVSHDGSLMSESLTMVLATVLLVVTLLTRDRFDARTALAFGALTGLGTLTRGEFPLLAGLLVLWLLWRHRPSPAIAARWLALAAMVVVLVIGPWALRNQARLGTWALATNLGRTLEGANCDLVYEGGMKGLWVGDPECLRFLPVTSSELEVSEEAAAAARARAYVARNWRSLPEVVGARVLRTWGLWPDMAQQSFYDMLWGKNFHVMQWANRIHLGLLAAATAGLVIARRRRLPLGPLLAGVVVVTLISVAFYGSVRFRALAEPSLVVLAALAVDQAVNWLRPGRQRSPVRH
jgi:4-amino-4-deoxy-L-arabinose transferase-like glycosyltransferase